MSPSGIGVGADDLSVEIDSSVAHVGRVYDSLLGGTAGFDVDRAAVQHVASVHPGGLEAIRASALSNRAFLARSVRWLARQAGVRQFLDIGAGIPNGTHVHEFAQRAARGAGVVYVDNDPVVLAHAHELLRAEEGGGPLAYLHGDLRNPALVVKQAAETLDFSQPVAVLLAGVLHFVPDEADPYGLVAELMGAVSSGSHLVVSHLAADIHPADMDEVQRRFNELTVQTWTPRNRDLVAGFFVGLDLVEPGVVQLDEWRPTEEPCPVLPVEGRTNPMWVGVGCKP